MIFNEAGKVELSANLKSTGFTFLNKVFKYINSVLNMDVLGNSKRNELIKLTNSAFTIITKLKTNPIGRKVSPIINRNLVVEGKPSNLDVKEYLSYSIRYLSAIITIAEFFINEKSTKAPTMLPKQYENNILDFKKSCKENNTLDDVIKFMNILLTLKDFKDKLTTLQGSIKGKSMKNIQRDKIIK